jgi:hypothetical protein
MTTTPDLPAVPMCRRSWYMAADDARRIDALVDDLHHRTRRPKHAVLAAVMHVAIEHRAEAEARLAGPAGETRADSAGVPGAPVAGAA